MRVVVRNALTMAVFIRGLLDRPTDIATVTRPALQVLHRAHVAAAPGETYDYELRPTTAGVLTLSVNPFNAIRGGPLHKPTTLTIKLGQP